MKRIIFFIFLIALPHSSYSQEEIITEKEIPALNKIIDSLENEFANSEVPQFWSLPQTTGHFFWLKTKSPEDFISALKNGEPLDGLTGRFPNLQIDRDLLIIKNLYTLTNGEQKVEYKSFQIKNNNDHQITLKASDSMANPDLKFYYSAYPDYNSNLTNIRGFYLNEKFVQYEIPQEFATWIHYTDRLVQPETELFYNSSSTPSYYNSERTPIDSLVNYYARVSQKPQFDGDRDFIEHRILMDKWEEKRAANADSLFKNDPDFKSRLFKALAFAENNEQSNGELEFFVAQLVSKSRALELMRYNRQVGSCSFDNGPINQQKRMAKLAAEIPEWNVFIQSFLNVMNDHVSRVANSNIASEARKTYIEELTKLDLEVKTLLLGSNMRIADTINDHYFSDGGKVGKAFSQLGVADKDLFEITIEDLIKNEEVDAFNKLHFYNTLSHYQYFLEDSQRKQNVAEKLEQLSLFMPVSVRSRLENPHKELTDLLFQERDKLKEFKILDSTIGNIYSYSYGGDCWMAEIQEKDGNPRIIYSLTMPMEDSITPLSNFLEQKNVLTKRVEDHQFINELLNTAPENKLYLKFTGDRSFADFQNRVLKDIPEAVKEDRNFENAISFSISYSKGIYVRFILFENNDLMILKIPKDFDLPNYSFEELVTNKKEMFLSVTYESYKVFDEEGEMIN